MGIAEQMSTMKPELLLSVINMKLRDEYDSLDNLCEDIGIEKDYLTGKLSEIGYFYNEKTNQFC